MSPTAPQLSDFSYFFQVYIKFVTGTVRRGDLDRRGDYDFAPGDFDRCCQSLSLKTSAGH